MKWLVPVDGSEPSTRAVELMIREMGELKERPDVHLLNVQRPLSSAVSGFVNREQVHQYHREEGLAALQPAIKKLDAAGVRYEHHIGVGDEAETIIEFARDKHCDRIVMASRGVGTVSSMLLGSVA